jgi:molybdopterin/thiamine biosynthesis adenylyltransferase
MTKPTIPYFASDGSVHFRLTGTLTSIEDPKGQVLALLELLDGQRDLDAIWRDLNARYPDVSPEDVREAIADLDESGFVQDGSDVGSDFGADARQRYARNLAFFETYASSAISKYEFQRRIGATKVAVLGVGGVGSHILIDLVAIGFTDIRIVDFDSVELSNLNRQILYGEASIGQPKVQVAADRARAMNSAVKLDVENTKLLSADDVYRVVYDRDIVIGSVDGPKMQIVHWLNAGCVRAGAALMSGGVDTQRSLLYTVVPGISGCVACWYRNVRTNDSTTRMVQDAKYEHEASGEKFAEDAAAFNGLVVLLNAHMVGETIRLATRISPPLSVGRLLDMSFHDPRLRVAETFVRSGDCEVCRDASPVAALRWLSEVEAPPI